jgi:hypothetical protein
MSLQPNIKVTLRGSLQPNVNVTLASSSAAPSGNQPVTVKSTARSINEIRDIGDVVEGSPTNGATLVYNSTLDKYEVRQLTSNNITITALDGGTF